MDALTYVAFDDSSSTEPQPTDTLNPDIAMLQPVTPGSTDHQGKHQPPDAPNGDTIRVHNGFPNPAAERASPPLSLDRLLIRSPCSTYFMRVRGHSWHRLGIFDGDIALVDRARTPEPDSTVVSYTEMGELVLCKWDSTVFAANPMNVWGVVTSIIHQLAP